ILCAVATRAVVVDAQVWQRACRCADRVAEPDRSLTNRFALYRLSTTTLERAGYARAHPEVGVGGVHDYIEVRLIGDVPLPDLDPHARRKSRRRRLTSSGRSSMTQWLVGGTYSLRNCLAARPCRSVVSSPPRAASSSARLRSVGAWAL